MVLKNKEEQKYSNNQLLEEVAENLQKIPFELQRKERVFCGTGLEKLMLFIVTTDCLCFCYWKCDYPFLRRDLSRISGFGSVGNSGKYERNVHF